MLTVLLALIAISGFFFGRLSDSAVLANLRTDLFDAYLASAEIEMSPEVAAINIDDDSIGAYGQWPWPRARLVGLIDAAAHAEASALAFDTVFADPDRLSGQMLEKYILEFDPALAGVLQGMPDTDAALATAFAKLPVILSQAPASRRWNAADAATRSRFVVAGASPDVRLPELPGLMSNLPVLEAAAAGSGISSIYAEADGIGRRTPLAFMHQGKLSPSMALEAVRAHLGASNLLLTPTSRGTAKAIAIGEKQFATDRFGRVWIPFANIGFPTYSAQDVMNGRVPAEALKGRIVVVGLSASAAGTQWTTKGDVTLPGHHLQAATIGALLGTAYGYRPEFAASIETILTAAAAIAAMLAFLLNQRALTFFIAGAAALAAIAISVAAFAIQHALIDPTFTILVMLALSLSFLGHILFAQRLLLLRERTFVGRVVDLMSEGLVITDKTGTVVATNPAANRLMEGSDAASDRDWRSLPSFSWTPNEGDAERRTVALTNTTNGHSAQEALEIVSAWYQDRGDRIGVHILRDMSELRRAEDAAAIAGVRLTVATDSMADGFALMDPQGRIILHNPALPRIIGAAATADLTGQGYDEAITAATRVAPAEAGGGRRMAEFKARMGQLAAAPQIDSELISRSGAWILARERATPDGGMVGVYTDITALKQTTLELTDARLTAEDANRAKNRFLANVSHELRTPLNAIVGFADAIRTELFGPLENEKYREYLGHILESGQELLNLVDTLLDVASVEAVEFELRPHPVALDTLTRRIIASFEAQAIRAQLDIVINAAPGMPDCTVDERAFRRILSNLLTNSLKYTPAGGRIEIHADHDADLGHRIVVADTGIGMTPAQQARAFDPFWKGNQTIHAGAEGVGLGLPLVRTLVERHGGTISMTSAPGEGARFTITLPPQRS